MRKIILSVVMFISFILVLSILIVGLDNKIGQGKKLSKQEKGKASSGQEEILKKYDPSDLNIDVYITKEKKVKTMNIEEYVLGVVAGEMPVNFHIEALKAQAVAARTYGLAHTSTFAGTKGKRSTEGDVDDTVAFQVYMSKKDRINAWPEKNADEYWAKLTKAIKETKGEVLSYDNKLVMAPYYFSTSSGNTEDAVDVFKKDIPYLKSVKSPGEQDAPKYKSQFVFTYNAFANRLNKNLKKDNLNATSLKKQVKILERSKAGSVKAVKIGSEVMTGANFRSLFGLTSSNFDIQFENESIVISCSGYGHGVGMSQWGAFSMVLLLPLFLQVYYYKTIYYHS